MSTHMHATARRAVLRSVSNAQRRRHGAGATPLQHRGLAPDEPARMKVKSSQASSARNRHKCCIATGACGRWQVRSGREDQQRSARVRHTLTQLPSTPPRSTVRFELLFFRNAAASWTGRPGRRITPRS